MFPESALSASTSSIPSPEELRHQHATTLQKLFDGTLTPKMTATKLSALTIPHPKIRRHKYAYPIQLLFENILSSLHEHPNRVQTVADLIISISELPPIWTKPEPGAPKHFTVGENMGIWDDEGKELGRVLNGEWEREFARLVSSYKLVDVLISFYFLLQKQISASQPPTTQKEKQ